jgi:sporulation protein YlmC with PRC-barrel domain
MPELSDFRLGADVQASDGSKAGVLASVLVQQDGFDPTALVVKDDRSLVSRLVAAEKLFVTDEVVVPISAVESATNDVIRLSLSAQEIRDQQPYLSYRFRPLTSGEAVLEEAEMLGGALGLPPQEEVANKPSTTIEIDDDENVMLGNSGQRLGRVQALLYDKEELIGVVITPDGFFKNDVVLPIRFISRADDLALFADLDRSDIENLKPYTAG